MKAGWLVRIGDLNFCSVVLTTESFTFGGTTYVGGVLAVDPPTEHADRQDQWGVTIAAANRSQIDRAFQTVAPELIELELIYDSGSGWDTMGVVSRGVVSSPVWGSSGTWRISVDTSTGDADKGMPLRWSDAVQQQRYPGDDGLKHMGPASETIVRTWGDDG